jgi:hypothetical protein
MSDNHLVQTTDQTLINNVEAGVLPVKETTIAEKKSELKLTNNLETSV